MASADPEPMHLGGGGLRIFITEYQRHIVGGLCMYCGAKGHFATRCPVKERARQLAGEYWRARLPFPHLTRLVPPSLPSCAVVVPPFPVWLLLTWGPKDILWMRTWHSITAFLFGSLVIHLQSMFWMAAFFPRSFVPQLR